MPADLAGNLSSAVYNAGAGTLTVTMLPFDGSPSGAAYNRQSTLDVGSYQAFDLQENGASRRYLALFQQNGNVWAGAVATEYRFANKYGGTIYGRADVYSGPTTGIASYQGSYAAVLTVPINSSGTPAGPIRIAGTATLNVDFNQQLVEGQVTNRHVVDSANLAGQSATLAALSGGMANVELKSGGLSSGTFHGDVTDPGGNKLGTYGGVVAAGSASAPGSAVAGVLVFTPTDAGQTPNYTEYGAMVLPLKCYSTAGSSTTCP